MKVAIEHDGIFFGTGETLDEAINDAKEWVDSEYRADLLSLSEIESTAKHRDGRMRAIHVSDDLFNLINNGTVHEWSEQGGIGITSTEEFDMSDEDEISLDKVSS